MTALTADTTRASRNLEHSRSYLMGTDICYAGGLVMLNSSGLALAAAASASNLGCVGCAVKKADDSAGAGTVWVTVQEAEFLFTADTLTQASCGTIVFADDDDTVDTTSTNAPQAGKCLEFVSATSVWVYSSPAITTSI